MLQGSRERRQCTGEVILELPSVAAWGQGRLPAPAHQPLELHSEFGSWGALAQELV